MGTAELACASLVALADDPRLRILGVVTQPDRPQGRNLRLQPPPVKRTALERNLPVFQPARARDPGFVTELAALRPDVIVVAAYGQILPRSILDLPPHGCLNVHTSLLPRYRGAAPIQWAILNGDPVTGVTIMRINERLDAGDILSQRSLSIDPDETAESLHRRLADAGAELLLETLPGYLSGSIVPRPQPDSGITYAPKIRKEDGHANWSLTAPQLYNRLRAFTPWPGLFTFLPALPGPLRVRICAARIAQESGSPGTLLRIGPDLIRVACADLALDILSVQPEGGRPMTARDYLAGHPLAQGTSLLGTGSPQSQEH